MTQRERETRLRVEFATMAGLQQASSIFRFETDRDPPDRYHVTFAGRGITRGTSSPEVVEFIDLHRCEIRLPLLFPDLAPDVRWLTPIFHPNVSFSGFVPLSDIGLAWNRSLGLDDVCERLWDVARAAFVDDEQATNIGAKNWYREPHGITLPADTRPLRDLARPADDAVIRCEQQVAPTNVRTGATRDVLYINEDTATPELPAAPRGVGGKDKDVLYIGDE